MGNPLVAAGGAYLDRPPENVSSLSGGYSVRWKSSSTEPRLFACPVLRQGEGAGSAREVPGPVGRLTHKVRGYIYTR